MKIFSKSEILQKIDDFYKNYPLGVLEIVGPTASGKTDFTVEIAKYLELNFGKKAEVIVVDSRQVYRECDISSAKISVEEMKGVLHWGIDLCNPNVEFNVYEFQLYAFGKIKEILDRGHIPIFSGGTMLWLDAVSEYYIFSKDKQEKSLEREKPMWEFLKVGIFWERQKLYDRINYRAKLQFENGLIEETAKVLEKYDCSRSMKTSFGYFEILDFLNEKISYEEALDKNRQRNRNYAKKQRTWWRGREDVFWVDGANLS